MLKFEWYISYIYKGMEAYKVIKKKKRIKEGERRIF